MKKITLLFLMLFATTTLIYGQCTTTTGGQWPTSTVTLVNSGAVETIATNNWPNAEFSIIENVLPGSDYTVAGSGMYITVTNTADDSVITSGSDSVSFTAAPGVTGLTIYWHLDAACGTNNGPSTQTTIQCTTCTCTYTVAPSCVTEITPVNNDLSATVGAGGSVTFDWNTDPNAESYELFINGFSQGMRQPGITFTGFEYGTAYTWSVVPTNCFSAATGCAEWSFTTESCTETVAPGVQATNPYPADAATAVSILSPDGGLAFNWTGSSDPNDFYILNIGIANPPTQAISGVEPGEMITGLEINTTYYWSIDVANCAGVTTGSTVWSFTTDSQLSITDEQLVPFSIYPNPANDKLNIKTTLEIDNVTVFNILGQEVASYNGNEIVDSSINISDYKSGLYLVQITSGDKTEIIKVTKK
ncbi:T9SS type A sorting domain-containing protein [Winogradskyella marincola]|uniref:T9SS type A sorting domain-containing protein n=1 Tax=Winogradskyella marincola TaxID=3037795 RepID=A0ABT6G1G5_9FLAO|nr:T9SS type A sorting domain-containing protein [Winogradskyella sp. YYF002]MDG4715800.1 T9SS type A sorting domain-containing protein [Winogradskyella sp. YYF002]